MDNQDLFLDNRLIDEYVFNSLIARGYAPSIDEAQTITDIFLELLIEIGAMEVNE